MPRRLSPWRPSRKIASSHDDHARSPHCNSRVKSERVIADARVTRADKRDSLAHRTSSGQVNNAQSRYGRSGPAYSPRPLPILPAAGKKRRNWPVFGSYPQKIGKTLRAPILGRKSTARADREHERRALSPPSGDPFTRRVLFRLRQSNIRPDVPAAGDILNSDISEHRRKLVQFAHVAVNSNDPRVETAGIFSHDFIIGHWFAIKPDLLRTLHKTRNLVIDPNRAVDGMHQDSA